MAYIFFNELGGEPIAYIGGIQPSNKTAVIDDAIHNVYEKHYEPDIRIDIYDSVHAHYSLIDYNAPVNQNCNRFLHVEYKSRRLYTVHKTRYLQTTRIEC